MDQMYLILEPKGDSEADKVMRRGIASHLSGKTHDAAQAYTNCLRIDPSHALCMNNMALIHVHEKDMNEGLLAIERAALVDPKSSPIHLNWAFMCMAAGRIDEALILANKAVQMGPCGLSWRALATIFLNAGKPDEAIQACDNALNVDPENQIAAITACFAQSLTDETPKYILARRTWFYEKFCAPLPKCELKPREPRERLRIGYISGDFKTHSASAIFRAVVLNHSRAIEAYCYSNAPDPNPIDPVTERFKSTLGKRWRNIASLHDDADVCALIQQDGIDILVDLSAHSTGSRLGVFARKPAPIQVTAWGFALGTGLPEIDYFFADPVIVPEQDRKYFAEKIYDLPCVMTIDKGYMAGLGNNPTIPYHKNGYITFGCFGRFQKISPAYLAAVRQILLLVLDSKIIFRDFCFRRPHAIRHVLKAFNSDSFLPEIDPKRIQFISGEGWQEHIQSYQQADIILDPFPHTGGVTSMEQAFMGCQIITRYGKNTAGRLTASLLTAIGKKDWIAYSDQEYIAKAKEMARDIPAIEQARKTLRKEFLKSPAMAGYVETVEKAYLEMWHRHLNLDKKQEEVVYA